MAATQNTRANNKRSLLKWSALILGCVILIVVGVVGLQIHADNRQTTIAFQSLERAADATKLSQAGTVIADSQSGRASISSDRPTRSIIVLAKETSTNLQTAIEAQLAQAGFLENNHIWQRTDGGTVTTATTTYFAAGDSLPTIASVHAVSANESAVQVEFTATPR